MKTTKGMGADSGKPVILKITSDNKVILDIRSILDSTNARKHLEEVREIQIPHFHEPAPKPAR